MQRTTGILSSEVAASWLDESTLPIVRGVKGMKCTLSKTELSSTSQQVIAGKVFKIKKKKANRKEIIIG